ncbi:hypothetical protein ACFQFQ_15740 [Sulfitobacter porphyrae]|uniref:Uncharacterized protein n=1 Tax=Sulfitobacter porphyrae TaxID=1246864 RepID=A0ABW2B5E6_9RHOB
MAISLQGNASLDQMQRLTIAKDDIVFPVAHRTKAAPAYFFLETCTADDPHHIPRRPAHDPARCAALEANSWPSQRSGVICGGMKDMPTTCQHMLAKGLTGPGP